MRSPIDQSLIALSAVALLVPLFMTVESRAALTNYVVAWNAYSPSEATIAVECKVGPAETTFTERASAPATQTSINVQMDTKPGDVVECRILARWGDQVSLPSEVASYTVPFPRLSPPTGVRLNVSLPAPGAL